jgi:16S rRNA (cytosine967-C5)-methyltransferase
MTTHKTGALTRAIAIDALTHVLTRRIHADQALDKLFEHHSNLRPLDRAFIFEMVYGSLRWLSKMDWIMSHMMERSFASLDPRVANALRVGAYQIYYMDRVPERAAVAETVEAMRLVGASNAVSFVNAILRRVARKGEYFTKPDKEKFPAEYLAMHFAHPKWMIERWLKTVPMERLEHLCMGNNQPPKPTLRIITRNKVPEGLDLATWLLREFSLTSSWRPLAHCLHVESFPPFDSCAAFKAGAYVVQDEAAQLVSSLIKPTADDSILDACAAPGTKAIIAWDDGVKPENLVVCDSSKKRLEVLQRNFERVGLKGCEVLNGDVVEVTRGRLFSKVVLDAPCSSLGVIRRHPEIKWLRSLNDVQRNAAEQRRLLDGLSSSVADGGELIYIVCSNEQEETTAQIDAFLQRNNKFQIVNPDGRIHDYYRKYVTRTGELLVLPGNSDNIDGFYAVILKKVR